jgi:DNA-binding NtrC family response regulator
MCTIDSLGPRQYLPDTTTGPSGRTFQQTAPPATASNFRADASAITTTVLVVYGDDTIRRACCDLLAQHHIATRMAATTEEALDVLDGSPIEAVLIGLRIPRIGGIEFLKLVRQKFPFIPAFVLTRYGTIQSAIEATRLGAVDYITDLSGPEDVPVKMEPALRFLHTLQEPGVLHEGANGHSGFGCLMGLSPRMKQVYGLIEKVGHHSFPVLIQGESGTGKELVARAVHFCGSRSDHPFVPVDCSALPATLIESELFGHTRGAFTGARESRQGLIENAAGGTLFLDEIGDLPLELQPKLLRVLQEREVKRLGSNNRTPILARVIAATNCDLETAVREGKFRQDLYFRVNIVQIRLPALRERRSDIPLLVNHFLDKLADSGTTIRAISDDAMSRLLEYDWPGNVRELENVIERAVTLSSGTVIQAADLPFAVQVGIDECRARPDPPLSLNEVEKKQIMRALRETHGSKSAAARALGIGKTTLYRKLKEYDFSSGM